MGPHAVIQYCMNIEHLGSEGAGWRLGNFCTLVRYACRLSMELLLPLSLPLPLSLSQARAKYAHSRAVRATEGRGGAPPPNVAKCTIPYLQRTQPLHIVA